MLSNLHTSLLWQHDMGADELIASQPVNRFALLQEEAPAPAAAAPLRQQSGAATQAATPAAVKAPPPPSQSLAEAEALAQAATTIEELRIAIEGFDGCALKATARNTVFADGCADSDIMLIGEAPGADEDRQGIPFCGASGQLLDKMLAAIGLSRQENCYITNTLFWRPPGNRTPTPEEMQICAPFVKKHIALFQPKLLILVGGTSAKQLLNTDSGVTRLRGKPHSYHDPLRNVEIPVRVLFHPSYLLRQPLHKKLAWNDLQDIRSLLT
jgi:DNA polymerase